MPVIAVGGFRPEGFMKMFRFYIFAVPAFMQAQKADGNISSQTVMRDGNAMSISVWRDKLAMRNYVMSGAHRRAMKASGRLGSPLHFVVYEGDEIPTIEAAMQIWHNGAASQAAKT